MDLDHALAQALAQYSMLRKKINIAITRELIGMPFFGARDALQWIEKLERPNATLLAETLGITRGGASKAVSKLQSLGLVERYQLPDNRKEVYYRLTGSGQQRLDVLRRSLEALAGQELRFLQTLPEEHKPIILDFLTGYMAYLEAANPALCAQEADACERH